VALRQANLYRAILDGANFNNVLCGQTFFTNVDLSAVRNLEMVRHRYPSIISVDTIYNSKGNISSKFLEGCGVPETMITFAKSLVANPIEYYSCFISYSTKDDEFARRLNERMKGEGLRVWFAPEEMKAGQKIHEQLYDAIRYHDKLILVLSEASMNSNWVQSEIRRARKHEREDKRRKLFPISLAPFGDIQNWDLFEADEGVDLAREIREYYIPDFSQWKDYDKFNTEFDKLLKALRADE
jgi:isopentenyl diphosphate isomerase/L-lactate dehydrogenase-like FMN-dependent dehydrogenase